MPSTRPLAFSLLQILQMVASPPSLPCHPQGHTPSCNPHLGLFLPRHLSGSFSEPGHLPCQQAWHVVELWEVPLCSPSAPQRGSRVRAISCRKSLMLCPHKLPGYLDLGGSRTPSPGGTLTFLCRCLVESAPEQAPTRPSSTGPTRIQGLGGFLFPQDSCGCGPLHLPSPPSASDPPELPRSSAGVPSNGSALHKGACTGGPRGYTHVCRPQRTHINGYMCLSPCHRPSLCTSRGTYIIDEVSDIGRAGGQHAWGLGAHSAERGISAQWWPSQGGTQACQLCWVAKLVDVVGVLGTKQAEFSPDQSQGGVSFSGTLCGEHLGGEDLDRSGGGLGVLGGGPQPRLFRDLAHCSTFPAHHIPNALPSPGPPLRPPARRS